MQIDLNKTLNIVLEKRKLLSVVSRVGLAVDVSGSMEYFFANGDVNELIQRTFLVADRFDDNHELDSKAFDCKFKNLEGITENNVQHYAEDTLAPLVGGGTTYAPVIKGFLQDWFKARGFLGLFPKPPSKLPAFLILQTDGDNIHDNEGDVERVLQETLNYPMFVFFLGLSEVEGKRFPKFETWKRKFPNVDYLETHTLKHMKADAFYEKLISQKLADFYHSHGISVK